MTLALAVRRLLFTAAVPWFRRPEHRLDGVTPGFIADIIAGRHALGGRAATFADLISVTTAAGKTYVDSDGGLKTAAANTPRFDWSSGRPELLLEGAATNTIRNSTMVGAVAGSPGMDPANWSLSYSGNGLTRTIVGIGTVNGFRYIDIRFAGTSTAAYALAFDPEAYTAIAGVAGQTWTYSMQLALIAGAIPAGRNLIISITERDAGGTATASGSTTINTLITSTLVPFAHTRTLSGGSTAYASPQLRINLQVGDVVDITLRIAAPQMEQTATASSYIPTAGTAVTRSADLCQLTPAAAAVLQGAGAALVLRSYMATAGGWTSVVHSTGGPLLQADNSTPQKIFFAGASDGSGDRSTLGYVPGSTGICAGWGPSGRVLSVNSETARNRAGIVDRSLAAIYIGAGTGLAVGQFLRLRQFVGWSLADRPSAAGVQTQARTT